MLKKLLEVARTATNCSKRQKVFKSYRAQSGQAYSQGLIDARDARECETGEVCERGMMGTSAERKQGMMGRKKRETATRVSG